MQLKPCKTKFNTCTRITYMSCSIREAIISYLMSDLFVDSFMLLMLCLFSPESTTEQSKAQYYDK